MARKPHAEAAQAPQAEIDILGPGAEAKLVMRASNRGAGLLGRGDGAEHRIGMTHDIFGGGLDRYVGAVRERLEIERRRPRVVQNDNSAARMRRLGDGRNVLHLEGLRAWRLGEHHFGVVGDELVDAGADQRIVIGGFDAEPLQHVVAEAPGGAIDAVGDQDLVTGRHEGEQRRGDGREAGGRQQRGVAAFELGDRLFERPDRGRAEPAIGEVLIVGLQRSPASGTGSPSSRDRSAD